MAREMDPIPGEATERAIPQAGQEMHVPAARELPSEKEYDGKDGGRIFTEAYNEGETRQPMFHGAVYYQEETADPGRVPEFHKYTELTDPVEKIRG